MLSPGSFCLETELHGLRAHKQSIWNDLGDYRITWNRINVNRVDKWIFYWYTFLMEMPEGWKRVYDFKDPGEDFGEVFKALDLMKEMAEALEEYEVAVDYWSNDDGDDIGEPARNALKKFKEWK